MVDSTLDYFTYDPADPTPSVGGAILGRDSAGAQDNRELENRADVLTYSTHALIEPLDTIGPVRLELNVYSSLEFTDFFGRLCDVDENGRSINVCDGLFRVAPGRGERQEDDSLRIEISL